QLLAFSRKQVLQQKIIDLNALIHELEKMLGRLIGEDIELITLLDSELDHIKVEPNQIEQVIMNIVVNARDAMPGGGKLTVETKNIVLGENNKTMENTAVEPGSYVLLSISDTGMGMDKETRSHIFEPFFTTKEKGKSTGLGLATVYGIIKQSGGYIWVDSKPGMGTTFKIYLPHTDEEITLDEKRDEPVDGNLKGKETVLIVEDEKDVRNLVCEILKLQGYNILEAGYGDRALNICKEYNKPIHLILTDIVMPHISGSRLVELVKPIHPEMKTLYMSGYTDNSVVIKGILKPGDQFIQKLFTPVDLARKIRGILDKK
ncbi:MAG: response regulator, partial [Calditrichales bacterium]|nr:response regulator [Calditrichales bacterium]